MSFIPEKKTGLARIWAAFFYSLSGLRLAITSESAFIQETVVFLAAMVVLFFLPLDLFWKALLFIATASVLVVELLNTALEAIVDMASPEYHDLAKKAKDLGSAAVLLMITTVVILWGLALLSLSG
ncbi:MAG: diacylglycerol kinase [Desulfuromonadales bacterium]|jgi:diacylglycerol kinase (ATP)